MHIHVIYSGNVQGVGFRYTAASTAKKFAIVGTVTNKPDMTVELYAEGENVEQFLEALTRIFSTNIAKIDKTIIEQKGSYKEFSII